MIKAVIFVSINFQVYGENLQTFCNQVTPEEKLLFSNEILAKVLFNGAPKVLFALN